MANPKQYKNVYTILEKVKKGEIQSHYKEKSGLFGKIDFYKKADLVKPHMHYIDERRLDNIVEQYIYDSNNTVSSYSTFNKNKAFLNIDTNKRPNVNDFHSKVVENYKKFPKHLKNDIFKMYYNKIEKLEFENRTDKNQTKFKFLEKANNPVGKIMSETSNVKSAIFTRDIIKHFATQMAIMEYIDPEKNKDLEKGLGGKDDFDQDTTQDVEKMLDSKLAKQMLNDTMNNAMDTCNELDESIPEDVQEELFQKSDNKNNAAKLDADYIKKAAAEIKKISMSMGSLKDKIKKILDKSNSYFSCKKEVLYEDLFNSNNLAGLDEYIMLHPKLRKFMTEDIMIKDTKSIGKINVYIDISGSMSDSCGVDTNDGNNINKLDFCKAFVFKLQQMDMLNDIFVFNDNVKPLHQDIISIAMLTVSGGTDINRVIQHIEKKGAESNNALIITDAGDNCNLYTEKAFFIGVKGCYFSNFEPNVMKVYSEKGQALMFDGSHIYNIDMYGSVVK